MISNRKLGTAEIEPAPAKLGHGRVDRQKRFRRYRAQRHDRLRLDRRNLPHQKRRASFALIPLRRTVSWRAALDNIRDVNVFAPYAHSLDHVVEQLSGSSYERFALLV